MDYVLVTYGRSPSSGIREPTFTTVTIEQLVTLASGGTCEVPALDELFQVDGSASERYAFVRPDDVEKFLKFAADQRVFISVRNTGDDTIKRLTEDHSGYACKPHAILDKTIKPKSVKLALGQVRCAAERVGRLRETKTCGVTLYKSPSGDDWWTEALREWPEVPTSRADPAPYEVDSKGNIVFARLIKAKVLDLLGNLKKLLDTALETENALGFVGWWVRVGIDTGGDLLFGDPRRSSVTLSVPIGILRVGPKPPGEPAANERGVGVRFTEIGSNPPVDAYTGDYDLHCVYWVDPRLAAAAANPATGRVRPSTAKNIGFWGVLGDLYKKLLEEGCLWRERHTPYSSSPVADRYAQLLQHGPQSQYYAYVYEHNHFDAKRLKAKSEGSELPDEEIVSQLLAVEGAGVLAFTPRLDATSRRPVDRLVRENTVQEVHLLRSPREVYTYYRVRGLTQDQFSQGTLPNLVAAEALAPELRHIWQRECSTSHGNEIAFTWLNARDNPWELAVLLMNEIDPKPIIAGGRPDLIRVLPRWLRRLVNESNTLIYVRPDVEKRQVVASTRLFPPLVAILRNELQLGNAIAERSEGRARLSNMAEPGCYVMLKEPFKSLTATSSLNPDPESTWRLTPLTQERSALPPALIGVEAASVGPTHSGVRQCIFAPAAGAGGAS